MAFHLTSPYFLRYQRLESSLNPSSDFVAFSILLITSTSSRDTSDWPPLSPSLASMRPRPSLFFRSLVLWYPNLLHDKVVQYYFTIPFDPWLAWSSFHLCATWSALSDPRATSFDHYRAFSLVNRPFVQVLGPELDNIPIDFIILDVQPLPTSSVKSSARTVVAYKCPPPPELHDWKWPLGCEIRLG